MASAGGNADPVRRPGPPARTPDPAGRPAEPGHDAHMLLTSVNAHAGYDRDGLPYDLAAACLRLGGGVIAMQEAWRADGEADQLACVAHAIGATLLRANLLVGHDLRALGITAESVRGAWGLALLTSLPVLDYQVAYLGRARGDVAIRAAQLVTLEAPGGARLRIANTHLTHRFTSPRQLLRLVRRLAADDAPTVIVGDLNMPAPVTGLAVGYSPAVTGRTFPAHRPVVQLDHILTGRGVLSESGEILPPLGSDHLPVRTRLRLELPAAARLS